MNILLINQSWFAEELRSLGHQVCVARWVEAAADINFEPTSSLDRLLEQLRGQFAPDVIVYLDDSGPLSIVSWEDNYIPSVFLSVDSHHHAAWHRHLSKLFDRTLVAQKKYLGMFQEQHPESHWFPLWAPRNMSPAEEKSIDVSFRGNLDQFLHPERADFFRQLQEQVAVDVATGPYLDVYPRSKIVINQSVSDDLNFRVFEAMMAGALLVTPKEASGLFELFEDGVDLVSYSSGDVREAAEKIRYYLNNDAERKQIASSGQEKVHAKHSLLARAKDLEKILLSLPPRSSRKPQLASAQVYLSTTVNEMAKLGSEDNEFFLNRLVKLVERSVDCLRKQLNTEEPSNDPLVASILLCCCFLRALNRAEQAIPLLQHAQEIYPDQLSLAVAFIEELTLQEYFIDAREFAAKYSEVPEDLMDNSSQLMNDLRKDLLGDLPEQIEQRLRPHVEAEIPS